MEEELDLTKKNIRVQILADIKSEDNHNRKRDQQKRHDVYNDQQDIYILERLRREFNQKTVQEMRKILSINLAKRMIDEKSTVYNREPERVFSTRSGTELSEDQVSLLETLYDELPINHALAKSNRLLNTHDQCALMCVPDKMGSYKIRAISPVHYDVIPSINDPEKAYAYILNVWDKDLYGTVRSGNGEPTQLSRYKGNDRLNQKTADDDDRKALFERYIVWTKDMHFVMNGRGNIMGEIMPNPIGMLPFVDVAPMDKDFQFFVRRGSGIVDFSLDFGMMLSDNANVIRLQSYSQAVISSEKIPENMTVGPNHILHLKLDPNRPELAPNFQFVTPNPDLAGTQTFLDSLMNLHLTSLGLDQSTVTSSGESQKFNSGLDRLLAMISKFDATREDFSLFKRVENELLQILYRWSNQWQPVAGDEELEPQFKGPTLPEDLQVNVIFHEPEAVQTKSEKMDSMHTDRENGYMSRIDVLMEKHNVDRDKAIEIAEQIDEDERLYGDMSGVVALPVVPGEEDGSADVQEVEGEADDQSEG